MSKNTIKATPTDQLTKAPVNADDVVSSGKKKSKTIINFRKALNVGRKNMDKYAKDGGKSTIEICIMGADGSESSVKTEYTIKLFTAGDWVRYGRMQVKPADNEGDDDIKVMSEYTAAIIMGCLDDDGDRIFSIADVELLEHPANATAIMEAMTKILTASGATADQDIVEKPD